MSVLLDLLVLSPHLDDGVLSCGGRIAATTAAGGRVRIATLFAADDPVEPANPLAVKLRRTWALPPGEVMAARRREDEEACRRLDAEADHWDLPDALYRVDAAGAPLYPTLGSLFGPPAPEDDELANEIAARIDDAPATALVLAPLAIGGHVDHVLARRAAERCERAVAFYEDFPYVEWKWFALRRALGPTHAWTSDVLALTPELLERRRQAILAYRSQVPALFRSAARLGKQLRRAARRAGGERAWRRRSPALAATR